MPIDIDVIYDKLEDEVVEMHYRWKMYCDVFSGGAEQTAMINRNGSNFFYYTQFLMIDHISLAFSKLTDPDKQGRNGAFDNLSVKQLHVVYTETEDAELTNNLVNKYDELLKACENFRELRNKRIAHADLAHALNLVDEPLPGISVIYISNALKILGEYMNLISKYRTNSTTAYDHIIENQDGSAKKLIKALCNSEKFA